MNIKHKLSLFTFIFAFFIFICSNVVAQQNACLGLATSWSVSGTPIKGVKGITITNIQSAGNQAYTLTGHISVGGNAILRFKNGTCQLDLNNPNLIIALSFPTLVLCVISFDSGPITPTSFSATVNPFEGSNCSRSKSFGNTSFTAN